MTSEKRTGREETGQKGIFSLVDVSLLNRIVCLRAESGGSSFKRIRKAATIVYDGSSPARGINKFGTRTRWSSILAIHCFFSNALAREYPMNSPLALRYALRELFLISAWCASTEGTFQLLNKVASQFTNPATSACCCWRETNSPHPPKFFCISVLRKFNAALRDIETRNGNDFYSNLASMNRLKFIFKSESTSLSDTKRNIYLRLI